MERNGELEISTSDLGPATYVSDKAPLTKNPIEVTFTYNTEKYGEEEFLSQGDMQEEGLNSMSVAEYLDNYERYQTEGRDLDDPQKLYRLGIVEANAYEKGEHMIADLMQNNPGLSYEKASHMIDQSKLQWGLEKSIVLSERNGDGNALKRFMNKYWKPARV